MLPTLLFLNLGGGEIFVILIVVLLFFGSKRIPELAKGLGKGMREFKDAMSGIENEVRNAARGVIIDQDGNRNATGTDPNGNDINMTLVNIHSGVPPEDDPGGLNRQNRGSAGCPTINPSDAEAFFNNFSWNNSSETTGNSSGKVIVLRKSSSQENLKNVLETKMLLLKQTLPETGKEINLILNTQLR